MSLKLTSSERFTLLNEDKVITKFYRDQRLQFWNPDEINFSEDQINYSKINDRYKKIYKMFLEFFVSGDSIITEQAISFLNEASSQEERMFLIAQLLNEQDHIMTYTNAIKDVLPLNEQENVFKAIENVPQVEAKGNFVLKYCENTSLSRGLRYFAGALSEGVFFASLFAMIFYFRRKNVFNTFIKANTFIMKDEILHRNFNCYMANKLKGFNFKEAHDIAMEAYEIEFNHMKYILREPIDSEESDSLSGITQENLDKYIKTLINQVLVLCNVPILFKDIESFNFYWMEDINVHLKTNFYEDQVVEYTLLSRDDNCNDNIEDIDF